MPVCRADTWQLTILQKMKTSFYFNVLYFLKQVFLNKVNVHTHTYTHSHTYIHTHTHSLTLKDKRQMLREREREREREKSALLAFLAYIYMCMCVCVCVCVGDLSRGWPEGSLFDSYSFPCIVPLYPWSVPYNAEC